MKQEHIVLFIFLFLISVVNQYYNKYLNHTVEFFDDEQVIRTSMIATKRQECVDLLVKIESFVKVMFQVYNLQNVPNTPESVVAKEKDVEEKDVNIDYVVEEFENYDIDGCINKNYESTWKKDLETLKSRNEIIQYIAILNEIYNSNIYKALAVRQKVLDTISTLNSILFVSNDTDFVECERVTESQQHIGSLFCDETKIETDVFTHQKQEFENQITKIRTLVCSLIVLYNDLHHLAKEMVNANLKMNSFWENGVQSNTNIQFKKD